MDRLSQQVSANPCSLSGTIHLVVPACERTILRRIAEHSADSTFVALPLGVYARATGFTLPEVLGFLERLYDWGLIEGSPVVGWRLTARGWQVQGGEK